ncbi:MAG: hypothetical protein F4213_17200, partial [Boseongicola sp. SB0677_bin_26]|nr:hypothetical protein [Boseongicola sp. SB0677_bin_26]
WGSNVLGQAGAPSGEFTAVSAGWDHSCGLRANRAVVCWGSNEFGQAGAPSGEFTAVSAGGVHSCGIKTDGTVVCWGDNQSRQSSALGGEFTAVSAGGWHSCGIKTDGTVVCWGYNSDGQTRPPRGEFTAISAGWKHTCGIKADRTAVCWGFNDNGQADALAGEFTDISADDFHTCGIRADRTAVCWGYNSIGQSNAPGGEYVDVAAGWTNTCAIRADLVVVCWGNNEHGQSDALQGSEAGPLSQELLSEIAYGGDPAGLIAFAEIVRSHTMGTDSWAVWTCDTPGGQWEISPEVAVERLESWAQPYYQWLSGGLYRPEFFVGGTVTAENDHSCQQSVEDANWPPGMQGAVIVPDVAYIDCETDSGCTPAKGGPDHCFVYQQRQHLPASCPRHWPDTDRSVVIGAAFVTSVPGRHPVPPSGFIPIHEVGHALAFPHSFDTPERSYGTNIMDVMGNGQTPNIGTPAINRYAAGWMPINEVAIHPEPVTSTSTQQEAVYELYPIGQQGTQMLVLQTETQGVFYTLGARTRTGFDSEVPVEGVEAYLVDQNIWCEDQPWVWLSSIAGTCIALSRLVDAYTSPGRADRVIQHQFSSGEVIRGNTSHVYRTGESLVIGNARVRITSRTADGQGYVVTVSPTT